MRLIKIYLLLIGLGLTTCMQAQRFRYGVTGGLNVTRMIAPNGNLQHRFRTFFAPTAGAFLNVNIGAGFSAQTSLNYSLNGGVQRYSTDSVFVAERVAYHMVNVPLFFQYSYKEFIFFRAGGYLGILTRAYLHRKYGTVDERGRFVNPTKQRIEYTDLSQHFSPVDPGILLSVGMQFADGFNIELRYMRGVTSILRNRQVYNSTLTFRLNYILNYSQKAPQFFSKAARHIIYLEGGGAGVAASANYEYVFAQHEHIRVAARVGLGLAPFQTSKISAVSMPVGIIGMVGKRNHHLELGLLHTTVFETSGLGALSVLSAGYRFQQPNGGLFFRIAYTPYISNYDIRRFGHWGGISIGYSFIQKEKKS